MASSAASAVLANQDASRLDSGSYILRSLVNDVALDAEGEHNGIRITCVETLSENLYIGTSAGEILHHVRLPPEDTNDLFETPTFILASRLRPPVTQTEGGGIQQILLLPSVNKACVLSNNTLNFYTLPELSPAFPRQKPVTCSWVGGFDLNQDPLHSDPTDGVVIMMCLRNRIRLVKIADEAARVRDIEFGACIAIARRGNFACVADARSYALLDVVNQQKIPLFSISSVDDQPVDKVGTNTGPEEATWMDSVNKPARSHSTASSIATRLGIQERGGHSRSSSLGMFRTESPKPGSARHDFDVPASLSRGPSPRPVSLYAAPPGLPASTPTGTSSHAAAMISTDTEKTSVLQSNDHKSFTHLLPLIASPSDSEFMLTTGTEPDEPGLGMIINNDGEMVRGTLQFSSYPKQVILDGKGGDTYTSSAANEPPGEEGFALAVVRRDVGNEGKLGVEVQRWDVDPTVEATSKEWLDLRYGDASVNGPSAETMEDLGIRRICDAMQINLGEIAQLLALRPIDLLSTSTSHAKSPATLSRETEEKSLISRLCGIQARITLWHGKSVFWVIRNPLVMQLEARIRDTTSAWLTSHGIADGAFRSIESLLNDVWMLKAQSELQFFTLTYIKQRIALLLLTKLQVIAIRGKEMPSKLVGMTEDLLIDSEVDPRIILLYLPGFRSEILQSAEGLWVAGGLHPQVEQCLVSAGLAAISDFNPTYLHLMKRVLFSWRKRKGNPSVSDGSHVFPTVDAALLRLLLLLDLDTPAGPAVGGSVRAELNALVDGGLDCFDQAVALLEENHRLYVLSRLYQSRKSAAKVLETWQRIINGERDDGGELIEGPTEFRKYLGKMRDRQLVEKYGTWLANKSPKIGVQVFADNTAKVRLEPQEALRILREKAPSAVKYFLEHLVFDKNQAQHINELIAYYLDIVVSELDESTEAKSILDATYETYRALQPPKPTYRQFITDNAIDAEWWHSRLRLLQLLGSNQGASATYDIPMILDRLLPYKDELVPEIIILDGRQGRHEEALRLLTHGLGDFDTAISYCLLGGSSIFRPLSGFHIDRSNLPSRTEQSRLFTVLLHEFLAISDVSERKERTSELLERFGPWFEVAEVMTLLPDNWAVDIFSNFLISALRRIVREKQETAVVKALNGSLNLKVSKEVIDKIEDLGPVVQNAVEV